MAMITRYEYIALLDIDEVIVPKKDQTWGLMMEKLFKEISNTTFATYNFRNAYFMDSMMVAAHELSTIPHHLHMLRHIRRYK